MVMGYLEWWWRCHTGEGLPVWGRYMFGLGVWRPLGAPFWGGYRSSSIVHLLRAAFETDLCCNEVSGSNAISFQSHAWGQEMLHVVGLELEAWSAEEDGRFVQKFVYGALFVDGYSQEWFF